MFKIVYRFRRLFVTLLVCILQTQQLFSNIPLKRFKTYVDAELSAKFAPTTTITLRFVLDGTNKKKRKKVKKRVKPPGPKPSTVAIVCDPDGSTVRIIMDVYTLPDPALDAVAKQKLTTDIQAIFKPQDVAISNFEGTGYSVKVQNNPSRLVEPTGPPKFYTSTVTVKVADIKADDIRPAFLAASKYLGGKADPFGNSGCPEAKNNNIAASK